MKVNRINKGFFYALIAAFCFGVSAPLVKVAADNIPVFFFQAFVSVMPLFLLVPIHYFSKTKNPWNFKKFWKEYFFIGIIGTLIPSILVTLGFVYGFAANASVMLRTEVFFVLVMGWLVYREKASKLQIFGIIIGFVGAIAFITEGRLQFSSADLLVAIGSAMYGSQFIVVKRVGVLLTPIQINIMRLVIAAPLLVAATLAFENVSFRSVLPYLPHAFVGNGLLVFVIGVNFYFAAVKYWDLWKVAFTAQFGAVFLGAFSSMFFLGEVFSVVQWIGALVIVLSMFIVLWKPKKKYL